MDMAYKIYANILNEKLVKEGEKDEKEFGFRKERTIDAIYT